MKISYKEIVKNKHKNLETNQIVVQQRFLFDQLFIEELDKSELYSILLDLYDTIHLDLPEMNENFKSNLFYELLCSIIDDNEYLSEELVINIVTKLLLVFGFEKLKLFCGRDFCQLIGDNLLKNIEKKSLELSIIRLLTLILSNSPENSEICIKYYQHIVSLLKNNYDIKSILIIGNFVIQMAKNQSMLISENDIKIFIKSDEPKIKILGIELLQILVQNDMLPFNIFDEFDLNEFLQDESNEVLSKTLQLYDSLITHKHNDFINYQILIPYTKNKFSNVRNCAIQCLISYFENIDSTTNIEIDFILFLIKYCSQCSYTIKVRILYLLTILIYNEYIQIIDINDEILLKVLHEILFIFQTEEYKLFTNFLNCIIKICNYFKNKKNDNILVKELSIINSNDIDRYLEQEESNRELIEYFKTFLS